jgi:DNA-binding GntR family transcriptional regulator
VSSDSYLSKGDVVFEALREMITRGDVLPGEPLRQRDLAARFNVSPTPVREALRRLESEGLVASDLHRGSRVAGIEDVGVEDAEQEESYRILAVLESLATGMAVEKMTDRDLEHVRGLERAFAQCPEGDPSAPDLNREFHFGIYECARSPLLLSLMRVLWLSFGHRRQLWRPHVESIREHRRLVDALAARDGELAQQITREHVLGSIDWMHRATRAASTLRTSGSGRRTPR